MKNTPFDKEFLDKQRQALIAKKARLEEELSKLGKQKPGIKGDYKATYQEYGSDEESNAQEYAQTETNIGVVENLEDELNRVDRALGRFESGEYGIDIKTGKPISRQRLEANPAAEIDIAKNA